MVKNFSEILPQEIGAIRAFEETIAAGGDPSLLGIVWAGLVTAEFIKELPNNGKHPQQGRIGSKRKNRPTPAERADKIAEVMLKAGKSPQEIGTVVAAVLGWNG